MVVERILPHLRALTPYSSARSESSGSGEVFLDANESPISLVGEDCHRYPDPLQLELRTEVARIRGVSPQSIFVGNGSDEAIDLLVRLFCRPSESKVVICPPTYGMYKVAVLTQGAQTIEAPLSDDFQLRVEDVVSACRDAALLFLCSPNNPTGNVLERSALLEIIERVECPVVLDEAYIDFAPGTTLLPELERHPNLIVLQTASKAWGLAGLRVGFAFAHPEIIEILQRVKPPYNVSTHSQRVALSLSKDFERVRAHAETLVRRRDAFLRDVRNISVVTRLFRSDANFVLLKVEDAVALYQFLLSRGVVVRNRTHEPGLEGCIRVSIGSDEEMQVTLKTLREYEKSAVSR